VGIGGRRSEVGVIHEGITLVMKYDIVGRVLQENARKIFNEVGNQDEAEEPQKWSRCRTLTWTK
jgi:hypothetical protein